MDHRSFCYPSRRRNIGPGIPPTSIPSTDSDNHPGSELPLQNAQQS